MIISFDEEKGSGEKTSFHSKNFKSLEIQGTFLNMIKGNYEKPTAKILYVERPKAFPISLETSQGPLLSTTTEYLTASFSLSNKARERKKERHPNWKRSKSIPSHT